MLKKEKDNIKIKKEFRLRGKKLYLTYAQLDPSVEFIKEEALEQLKKKIKNIREYAVSQEFHKDGGIHIHCFFELNVKIDISGADCFDLIFNGINYHGNYQIGKRKQALLEYIIKDGDYITNMILPVKDGKLLKPEEHLFYICQEEGLNKAEESLYEYYPLIAARKGSTILNNLSRLNSFNLGKKNETTDIERVFHIDDFDKLPDKTFDQIINWVENGISSGFSMTMVLHGPPGTGKTQLGRSIFNFMKTPYLEVSEIQDFKKLDLTKHRGILVDDVDFEPLSRGIRLNVLDSRASKTVDVKYGSVTTEAFIPRIVTTNNINAVHGGLKELERRIKIIFIPEQISSKFDLQINIQNIQQNYYFGNNIGISKERLNEMSIELEEIKKKLIKQKEFNNDFNKNLIDIK